MNTSLDPYLILIAQKKAILPFMRFYLPPSRILMPNRLLQCGVKSIASISLVLPDSKLTWDKLVFFSSNHAGLDLHSQLSRDDCQWMQDFDQEAQV